MVSRTRCDGDGGGLGLRPGIALSWRRAELCGLDPGSVPREPELAAVDRHSRLMAAARPVLDELKVQLTGTRFSLLLADRDSRIVARRCGRRDVARSLDGVLAMPGNRYSEETTGTNALASAYEVGSAISVHGQEHFLERLKAFTCHGRQIRHPLTGALEGVLDVTGYVDDPSPLLGAVVGGATREIEKRLIEGVGTRQQAMLSAYQRRTGHSRRPVVVFGDDLQLLNGAASALLDGPTQVRLRELADLAGARGGGNGVLRLASGAETPFRCDTVDGAPGATLVELFDAAPCTHPVPRRHRTGDDPVAALVARARRTRGRVLICGEPGTGRTRTTRTLRAGLTVVVLEAGQLTGSTSQDLIHGFAPDGGLTVIEDLHLLGPADATALRAALDGAPAGWAAVTSVATEDLSDEQRSVAARCAETVELLPLRHRREELPRLAREVLVELDPRRPCALTPAADAKIAGAV